MKKLPLILFLAIFAMAFNTPDAFDTPPPGKIYSMQTMQTIVEYNIDTEIITVTFKGGATSVILTVYNTTGELVYQSTENAEAGSAVLISANGWHSGEYAVGVNFADGTIEKHGFTK